MIIRAIICLLLAVSFSHGTTIKNSSGIVTVDGSFDVTGSITAQSASFQRGVTTNTIYVNQLATGGTGTESDPWTGLTSAVLTNKNTQYLWPSGVYAITNTINLLNQGTYHKGDAGGTILKYSGSGVAVEFRHPTNGWVLTTGLENFRIDCSNAVRAVKIPTSITLSNSGTSFAQGVVTLTNHGYVEGEAVDIIGASNSLDYNGVRHVQYMDPDHFSYQMKAGSTAPSPATGSLSIRKSSVALQLVKVRQNYMKNITVANCSLGIDLRACVTGVWDNITCSHHAEPGGPNSAFVVTPLTGLMIGGFDSSQLAANSTCQVFNNVAVEGVSDWGVIVFDAWGILFNVGTSEGNGAGCMVSSGRSGEGEHTTTFVGWDNEFNTLTFPDGKHKDWYIYGRMNLLQNCKCTDNVEIYGGSRNRIEGGLLGTLTIGSGATGTVLTGVRAGAFSTNLVDNGSQTIMQGVYHEDVREQDQVNSFLVKPLAMSGVADGGTQTINASISSAVSFAYTGSFTMANPTNPKNGQELLIRMQHGPSAGTYTVTWDTAWKFSPGFAAPTLDTVNGYSYVEAVYNSADSKWYVLKWTSF